MRGKQQRNLIKLSSNKAVFSMAMTIILAVIIIISYINQNALTVEANISDASDEGIYEICQAFNELRAKAFKDPDRIREVTPVAMDIDIYDEENDEIITQTRDVCTIRMGNHEMHYIMEVIGDPDEYGNYPLYIALHGGGGGPAEINNEQWLEMADYYKRSVKSGIYVAVRGIEDVWNTHFLDESYAMYDRLIEDMYLLKRAEPNKVYLLGFSAGGDGVYAIAPRMADRFAAVNMSSGHPNGVSLLNTSNLPFEIQVGIRDFYSEDAIRSIRGAEYEAVLNSYSKKYGCKYPHRILVHVPEGHNYNDFVDNGGDSIVLSDPELFAKRAIKEDWVHKFLDLYESIGYEPDISNLSYGDDDEFNSALLDYVANDLKMELDYDIDCNAVNYVSQYLRSAFPETFVWDLSTRAPGRDDTAFYWLSADFDVNEGVIKAHYDAKTNTVELQTDGKVNGEIKVLATPFIMDLSKPLTIITPDTEMTVDLKIDKDIIAKAVAQTQDPYLSWTDEIPISLD